MNIFIICGYGQPKNVSTDQNYITYLHSAFNRIYELAAGQEVAIIPCGGPTNCEPPYQGTEAQIIADYLEYLKNRPEIKDRTTQWTLYPEDRSLSTIENLLFAKQIMEKEKLQGELVIFCEKTREKRLVIFSKQIFPERKIDVEAIDFDISKNRYLDPKILEKKEKLAIEEGLWTLEDPTRLAKHHELFEKKFEFFRKRQSEGLSHVNVVQEWFEHEETIIRELMPDYPFLKEL